MAGDTLSAASEAEEMDLPHALFPVFTIPPTRKRFLPPDKRELRDPCHGAFGYTGFHPEKPK
jgi:hypothetical protein